MNRIAKTGISICLIVLCAANLWADESKDELQDKSLLTIDRIFDGDEFELEKFGPARWLENNTGYTTLEDAEIGDGKDIVRYDPETGKRDVLISARLLVPPGETAPLSIDDYQWSKSGGLLLIFTNTKRVWRQNTRGDYWVLDIGSRMLKQIGGDAKPSTLMFAKFSPDGKKVGYVRENNIYVEDLIGGEITQLTDDGSEHTINGTFDWVYEEELALRDGFRWSPDSRKIAYWKLDSRGVRDFYLINNTDSLYPNLVPIPYPKVGQTNSAARIFVKDVKWGDPVYMDIPGDPREHYIARMEWADNSEELIVQQLNRLQNTNRVMLCDASSGKTQAIFADRDDAWVETCDDLEWLYGGKNFTWLSERDGWRHAYLVSRSGEKVELLTPGNFDIVSIEKIVAEKGWMYFIASPDNATQRYLYRIDLQGKRLQRLTPEDKPGTHSYQISEDGRWAIHTYSTADAPPVIDLVRLPEHESVRTFADNSDLREAFDPLAKEPTEFFRVDIGDGVELDAWCIKPADFDPTKKYPLLVHVYGETAAQTVLDRWGGKRGLWHLMLAQQGYVVMSFDNRGTPAPRGRDWRKVVYRQIGILSSQEQAAAVRAVLEDRPYLDSERVAYWGWSGGGSMSLNMIFRYPDLVRTAMAVAPVPNQRLYDSIYQERYMGLPQDNVEGYREASPITYAHQLEGNLLLVHGTGDDNVHYQGMETLVDELIANNKQFTMMSYPNRTHAIREGANTTRHLYSLLTRYLEENLPVEP